VRGSQQEELRKQVLALLPDLTLDALVYATFDHPPALVAEAALTNPKIDIQGLGSNRRLSAVTGFPALTIPAGTATGWHAGWNRIHGQTIHRASVIEGRLRIRARNSSPKATSFRAPLAERAIVAQERSPSTQIAALTRRGRHRVDPRVVRAAGA
jgi:hypothetical protein